MRDQLDTFYLVCAAVSVGLVVLGLIIGIAGSSMSFDVWRGLEVLVRFYLGWTGIWVFGGAGLLFGAALLHRRKSPGKAQLFGASAFFSLLFPTTFWTDGLSLEQDVVAFGMIAAGWFGAMAFLSLYFARRMYPLQSEDWPGTDDHKTTKVF